MHIFPKKDLEIYKVVRVVNPRLRKRTKLSNDTHGKCVSKLLRIFEVPLHRFIDPKRMFQSHTVFMTSPTVTGTQCNTNEGNTGVINKRTRGVESFSSFENPCLFIGC
jgi:hypothetical protein